MVSTHWVEGSSTGIGPHLALPGWWQPGGQMHWLDWEELAKSAWQNVGKLGGKKTMTHCCKYCCKYLYYIYIYTHTYTGEWSHDLYLHLAKTIRNIAVNWGHYWHPPIQSWSQIAKCGQLLGSGQPKTEARGQTSRLSSSWWTYTNKKT